MSVKGKERASQEEGEEEVEFEEGEAQPEREDGASQNGDCASTSAKESTPENQDDTALRREYNVMAHGQGADTLYRGGYREMDTEPRTG